jgi:hypothetical protein
MLVFVDLVPMENENSDWLWDRARWRKSIQKLVVLSEHLVVYFYRVVRLQFGSSPRLG